MATWSAVFAAVAAVAALASLIFAWKTVRLGQKAQEQYARDRRRERLERIAERVSEVRWAAHDDEHKWIQPRDHLEAVLGGRTESLPKCQEIIEVEVPRNLEDTIATDQAAADVEQRAKCAQAEIKDELNALEPNAPSGTSRSSRKSLLAGT